MRSLAMKFCAIILAALCLLAALSSGLGIALVSAWESDGADAAEICKQEMRYYAWDYAYAEARYWATTSQSTVSQEVLDQLAGYYLPAVSYDPLFAGVSLHSFALSVNGEVVESGGSGSPGDARRWTFQFTDIRPTYMLIREAAGAADVPGMELVRTDTYNGKPYYIYSCNDLTFQVQVTLYQTAGFTLWNVLEWVWQIREALLWILLGSLLLLAVCMVYLCWAAGRRPKCPDIHPGGLNRLPLDLYVAADCILGFLGIWLMAEGVWALIDSGMALFAVVVAVADAFALCLLVVGLVFCFAAQIKVKGYWWRHSVIGFCLLKIYSAGRLCLRGLRAVCRMIPVIWQWLLTAAGMVLVVLFCFAGAVTGFYPYDSFFAVLLLFSVVACIGIVLYGGWCFGTILKAAKRMAQGDLDRKIDTKNLYGSFRDCAQNLNTLSQAAMVAARKQMQSERMKTELITNVSHDIKTPLTSIINYVDLLQQPHTEQEGEQYLDVLARQSQRLKKLTEDLVEMSKASTGNVQVELSDVDAGEAVLQALGEFGDKLDAVPLSVVFPQPQAPVMMRADGRLAWRVMSNLLGNTVKYAMPGTRLYVQVEAEQAWVRISFKNISRESLNISAGELMERFVRGDASRNTEGSGLGLNIAKSLMDVQGGSLELTVDGDLFKVTLTFPAV